MNEQEKMTTTIYGLNFEHCNFEHTTFQTLVTTPEAVLRTKDCQKNDEKEADARPLPPELDNERAIAVLKRCVHEGWLDEVYQPKNLTIGKKSVLADVLSRVLGIKDQWRVFADFWGMNRETLRKEYYKQSGETEKFEKEVKKIFRTNRM